MASETFEYIGAQLVFASSAARDAFSADITSFLSGKRQFRDAQPTIKPTSKYGGPGLAVTIQMADRVDADALWDRAVTQAFSQFQSGSWIRQSSVTFDATAGTQTVDVIHIRSFPAAPDDH